MDSQDKIAHLEELDSLSQEELFEREKQTPDDIHLLVRIAGGYLHRAELDKAEEYYRRALDVDPDDPWTYIYLGNLHNARTRFPEAISCFTRAAELLPGVACPYWCLGDAYATMGEPELAEAHYKKAVDVEPDNTQAQERLDAWKRRKDSE